MEENERMAIVENEVKHISIQTTEIKALLIAHIEKDADKMTRAEAYKAFAYKTTEKEVGRVRTTVTKAVWWGITTVGSLVVGLVLYILNFRT